MRVLPPRAELPARYAVMSLVRALEPEIRCLHTMVQPGTTALDVGASHGVYSYALARLDMRVEAFEPQGSSAATLEAWARGRVHIHRVAVSDVRGTLPLRIPMVGRQRVTTRATLADLPGKSVVSEVPVRAIDDFEFVDVSFMKIDVEGHEEHVLRGAEKTIARCRPTLLVEIEERHLAGSSVERVFSQIRSYGYSGRFLQNGTWRPLTDFAVGHHQRARLAGDASAPYINNFVFGPEPRALHRSMRGRP